MSCGGGPPDPWHPLDPPPSHSNISGGKPNWESQPGANIMSDVLKTFSKTLATLMMVITRDTNSHTPGRPWRQELCKGDCKSACH